MAAETDDDKHERNETEGTDHRYCALREAASPALPLGLSGDRARALITLANKWANGTLLHYYFFTDPDRDGEMVTLPDGRQEWRTWVGAKAQQDVVRQAFRDWEAQGIGIPFVETAERAEAEIRIGFMRGDGSWSYIGTGILDFGPDQRTMNFGWDLRRQDGPDTARHEIGHTLGLPHEHQNPNAGIVWDEEAVYAALAAPPNEWKPEKTYYNIIRKIAPDSVQGSNWDPDSIMHYPFEAGLIQEPAQYRAGLTPAGGFSARDIAWVRTFYPELETVPNRALQVGASEPLAVRDGQQANFIFEPPATRKHQIQTFGACDTQIVLFEDVDGAWRYLAADDDSGEDRNAQLKVRLRSGRRYAVRVRLKYSGGVSRPAVMVW